jgi:tetratricopeptide (TPR) repeat protein
MLRRFESVVFRTAAAAAAGALLAAAAAPSRPPATRPAAAADAGSRVIRSLEDRVARDPDDIVALNHLSGEYLRRFRESGDDADLDRALKTAEQSLKVVPAADLNKGGLAARAHAAFSLHRFSVARDDARQLLNFEQSKRGPLELLGDALLELGDYAEAGEVYSKVDREFESEDAQATTEVRLARFAMLHGAVEAARRRFDAAVQLAQGAGLDPPTPAPPEVLAWVLVQAGQFDFMCGRWDVAEKRYRAALDVKPQDWPALDHLAELRAAQKRYDEAVGIYTPLVQRVPRPELFQALGDVYREMGKPDDARAWHTRAASAFRQAADRGSAHYFHHLAGFYCDVESNPTEALRWAREDMKVRHSVYAHDALAWALYAAGDYAGASAAMDKALALGTADSHLVYHASLIYARAGDARKAQACLKKAAEVNPHFMAFHVHR